MRPAISTGLWRTITESKISTSRSHEVSLSRHRETDLLMSLERGNTGKSIIDHSHPRNPLMKPKSETFVSKLISSLIDLIPKPNLRSTRFQSFRSKTKAHKTPRAPSAYPI